jgi:putative Holliday junction resolvase
VVGIDLGERRIGVSVSDSAGVLASPKCTIVRSGDPERDRAALVALIEEVGAATVVVGLPIGLDGREGQAASRARQEIDALAARLAPLGIEIEAFDERLTTVSAERALTAAGRRGPSRRRVVDQAAAAILLQAWLDGRRGS